MQEELSNIKQIGNNKYFSMETEDGKTLLVDSRIRHFSKLLHHIIEDYQVGSDISKLRGVISEDIKVITDFCDAIDYNYNLQILPRPLPLDFIPNLNDMLEAHPKLKLYYSKLNSFSIYNHARIADFFDVNLLEDILYLKLHEAFSSRESIESFFKEECEENNTNINKVTSINKERENFLKDKYMIYCEKYISQLSDEDVEKYLVKELENKIING